MKRHLRVYLIIMVTVVILMSPAMGQQGRQFDVTSSPNVVGSGARAMGVGGAFIAIADDATAASWNPAALIIMRRPEAAIMLSYEDRERWGNTKLYDFNYIAVSYPFTLADRNMVVSFNYQRLFDFNRIFINSFHSEEIENETWQWGPLGPPGRPVTQNLTTRTSDIEVSKEVTGDIGAIAPAFAIQIVPKLSVGVTVNFWMDGLVNDGYSSVYTQHEEGNHRSELFIYLDKNDDHHLDPGELIPIKHKTSDPRYFTNDITIKREFDFFGINANLGLLWMVTPELSIGAVYKMPFTAKVDFVQEEEIVGATISDRERKEIREPISRSTKRYKIAFPAVYGLGMAWRFNDEFTMALDVSYTEWNKFIIREYEPLGVRAVPTIMGTTGDKYLKGMRTSAVNGVPTQYARVKGAYTARLGAEYLFILTKTIIPARLGFAYDPEPAQGNPDDFYDVTGGTGIMLFDRLIFDIAYVHRWSQSATLATWTDVDGNIREEKRGPVTQHIVMLSTIFHF